MNKTYIITEDSKEGFKFFETLAAFNIFKNTDVISSAGFTNLPKEAQSCLDNLVGADIERNSINMIILFDTKFPSSDKDKKRYNDVKKGLRLQKARAKVNGIGFKQPNYLCWESLILSCKELPKLCELGLPHKQAALNTFYRLHTDIYDILTGAVNKGVLETDYNAVMGNYGSSNIKTLEVRFSVLLTDIAGRPKRRALALVTPSSTLGDCWKTANDCYGGIYLFCGSCEFRNTHNKLTPLERMQYLVDNSFIKDYFSTIL